MILHEKLCSTCWQLVTLAQVVIALSGGELIYFELSINGQLLEVDKKDLAGDVACLDVAPVPEGRQRSRFLAVASYDSTVTFHLFGTLTLVLQAAVDLAPSATEPGQVIFLEYRQAASSPDSASCCSWPRHSPTATFAFGITLCMQRWIHRLHVYD